MQVSEYLDSAVHAAQLGERWAWQVLYEWVTPKLVGYVTARGAHDPDDAVGEVWLQVSRNISSFQGSAAQFRSWVFMIAHNRVVDQSRRLLSQDEATRAEPATHIPSAEEQVLTAGRVSDLAAVLDRLPAFQRSVVLLRVVADLSVSETAEALGRSTSAVKTAQHRAVKRLRSILETTATDLPSQTVTRAI